MDNKYREYLISKKWWAYKRAIYFLYEEECFICMSKKNLIVHHKTYDRLYNEDLDDLVLVCGECHSKIHDNRYTKEVAYDLLLNWKFKTVFEELLDEWLDNFLKK